MSSAKMGHSVSDIHVLICMSEAVAVGSPQGLIGHYGWWPLSCFPGHVPARPGMTQIVTLHMPLADRHAALMSRKSHIKTMTWCVGPTVQLNIWCKLVIPILARTLYALSVHFFTCNFKIRRNIFPNSRLNWSNVQAVSCTRFMVTSPNGNIFRVTGPLWISLTKASDAECRCFL